MKEDTKPVPISRFSPAEMEIIKSLFKDNDGALRILRKIFLPELMGEAPIGHQVDLWQTMDSITGMMPEQAMPIIMARIKLVNHIEQCLMALQFMANAEEETPAATAARAHKNSSK